MKRTLRIAVSAFVLAVCAVAAHERAFANYYANAGGRKDGGEHSFYQYLCHIISSEGGAETPTPSMDRHGQQDHDHRTHHAEGFHRFPHYR